MNLWPRYYGPGIVPTNTIYQDSKSTIILEENGTTSSSSRTKNLNTRYFFMTDKIKKVEVKVAFCPTDNILCVRRY